MLLLSCRCVVAHGRSVASLVGVLASWLAAIRKIAALKTTIAHGRSMAGLAPGTVQ